MNVKLIVKGIILNKKTGKVLLLQRSADDPIGANEWENAGGNPESSEFPEQAICREIMEETGLEVAIKSIAYVTYIPNSLPYLFIVYLCEANSEIVTISEEHQAYHWVDKEQCRQILTGGIAKDFLNNGIYEMSWTN